MCYSTDCVGLCVMIEIVWDCVGLCVYSGDCVFIVEIVCVVVEIVCYGGDCLLR